ncbi:hypothetical protein ANME2D_03231 [Candidatus Methanoperedens nitroreducens]|uniref:GIY-YIG domain-containing protein n=1 Tax=Candidatus Methanoperedens nitratireducens TaxID=1392998 RepID=A0A062UVZ6_9EURY|nr:GIY-YIG nuclease family protein [Candidatus Methanoperedens nitroreducens]KCZ71196.1 hypothetical protein ANME2D_03231 [Candidatus Methanoperedens nitroreducens]MDJ1421424.1 GIY-YIG nuclease family protein [Candidatus Methanoperedens sp.]
MKNGMKGAYVLILRLDNDVDIQVGKLGEFKFKKGFYAYVGSAHGTGGFKRVTRHLNVSSGINSTRKWHIDYLLPYSGVVCAVLLPTNNDIECPVAKSIGEFCSEIPGFGCSDCSCPSHLFFTESDLKDRIINTCNKLIENESIIISQYM